MVNVNLGLEQSHLHAGQRRWLLGTVERKGVVARRAQAVDEAGRSVGAVDHFGADAIDGFEQFVVVGMVRQWYGVVDSQPVTGPLVRRPAGDREANGVLQARQAAWPVHSRRHHHDVPGERHVVLLAISQVDAARPVDLR